MTVRKRKNFHIFIIGAVLVFSMLLSSCVSKPDTIEALISSNKEIEDEVKSTAEQAGMTVDIKGNEIIYSYDLSAVDGASEETLKEESMIATLQDSLDSQKSVFGNVCKQIEKESGIDGVSATINYTFGDEVLVSGTFTAGDAE